MKPFAEEEHQQIQREYYARTADKYDAAHGLSFDEHQFALAWLVGLIGALGVTSVLDIGAGTGRALRTLKTMLPHLRVIGVEPSPELRAQGHGRGLGIDELIGGDGMALAFADGEFDLVCEFGVLHHLPRPATAVSEMLRVAREAVFISDSNNFGQGTVLGRGIKQIMNALGLWRAFDFVRTKGHRLHFNEGDGLFYSYSVFDNYNQIVQACRSVHVLNTTRAGRSPYRSAPQVALLGLKTRIIEPG